MAKTDTIEESTSMADEGTEETKVQTAQEKHQARQKLLKGMTNDQLAEMIESVENLHPSIRELVLEKFTKEHDRRIAAAERGDGSRVIRSEEFKAVSASVRDALVSMGVKATNVTVSIGFDGDGNIVEEDARGRSGPRVRSSEFSCTVSRDGETYGFTAASLKELLVAVYPDMEGKKAANPSAFFRVRGVDVWATKADGSQVLVNPTT